MPTVTAIDIERMRAELFFDGDEARRKLSRFWMLLVLAGVIATAGVIGDSTATVIGAMIVAPLMTPILGIVLAIVLGDRANLLRCIVLVVAGASAVVALAWLMGHVVAVPVLEATNSQVSARVTPRLIDLVAALATGAVGAFALCRSDISDTLPGVAIAISLVPPLAVVGLTLEAGAADQASGALLLFATNVAAILVSGIVVMAVHRVHTSGAAVSGLKRRNAVLVVAALIVVVALPLAATTKAVAQRTLDEQRVDQVAADWAAPAGWEVMSVSTQSDGVIAVKAVGEGAGPSPAALRTRLDAAGLGGVDVRVELIPEVRHELPGH